MAQLLKDRVAVVTGGGGGIGGASARRLAEEGASVVVADYDMNAAEAVADSIGDGALAVRFDARDPESVRAVIAKAVDTHGRLDVLHNNVAITSTAWGTDGTVASNDLSIWDAAWEVNLRSFVVATQAALPHLIDSGNGSVINMASQAALRGSPGLTAYGTTKAAVAHLTRYLAVQHGRDGVRTNCIAPGVILTPQLIANAPQLEEITLQTLPYYRVGTSEDVANLVVFLASDQAAFINGQVISIDGGSTAGVSPKPADEG